MRKPDFTPIHEKTVFDDTHSGLEAGSGGGVDRPILMVLDGGDLKHRYPLEEPELMIGRDLTCRVILTDSKVSRRHAQLIYKNFDVPGAEPVILLKDLGSTNGCYVNGDRITEIELHDRDKITIGSTLFGYFLRDEETLKADETLIQLASFDALTGLRNRGVFNGEIQREFDRARRYKRPLSLLMFDIDHFKKINDTYGHQVGDEVLRELGALVALNCRSNDLPARYGGEEFAVILPETPLQSALVKAERMRKTIMNNEFRLKEVNLSITVSVGVASADESIKSSEEMIELTDKALYRAKANGRNKVVWHTNAADTIRESRPPFADLPNSQV